MANWDIHEAQASFIELVKQSENETRWQLENPEFMASYNKTIENEGLPLNKWRTF
jgi:antitoxin CcdA